MIGKHRCSAIKPSVCRNRRRAAAVHKRFGSLPWERTIKPAIEMAEEGIALSDRNGTRRKGPRKVLEYQDSKKIFTQNEALKQDPYLFKLTLPMP